MFVPFVCVILMTDIQVQRILHWLSGDFFFGNTNSSLRQHSELVGCLYDDFGSSLQTEVLCLVDFPASIKHQM